MKVVHITRIGNLDGIRKYGVLRHKPLLTQYNEVMIKDYPNYNPDFGLVFSYILDQHVEKFLRDFAYWDTWGKPRNLHITPFTYDEYLDLQEMGVSGFPKFKLKSEKYIALLLDIKSNPLYGHYYHVQTHNMDTYWGNMNTIYEHNDKLLALINYDVPRKQICGIIGSANSEIKRQQVIINSKMNRLRRL